MPQLADATYAHTLVIKSTHQYKYLIFIDSFIMQTLRIHYILNFFELIGFIRHYLLNIKYNDALLEIKDYLMNLCRHRAGATITP